jgi:hypothetical protein
MELLKVTYCKAGDKFFKEKGDMPMGSSLSPIVCNICMKYLRNKVLTWRNTSRHSGSGM